MEVSKRGFRPIVIVSGDLLNKYAPVLWVVPLTSKIKKLSRQFDSGS